MNAYISYSINDEDNYIIPLLSASLSEKGLFPYSRDWKAQSAVTFETATSDSQIFVGIITSSTFASQVVTEFKGYRDAGIASILFIEDKISISDEGIKPVIFSRTKPQRAFQTLFELNQQNDPTQHPLNNIAFFIGGVVLEFLSRIFSNQNSRNYYAQLNSIHVVEQRLQQLNEARFQEMVDVFLAQRYPEITLFLRKGSQKGVQKTVPGTPDTLIQLENGNYILIEATTQQKGFLNKVLDDIDKATNEQKTGVAIGKIWKIIICINRVLELTDIQKIQTHARTRGVLITDIYSLERLAVEIYLHHEDLAADYLELGVDTGQIVSVDEFVNSYNAAGHSIAAGLTNPFKHRAEELEILVNAIEHDKLILISGPAGVGKTKLALEGIRVFTASNPEYQSYAIQNKDVDILEDLHARFSNGRKSILFIDDVNRFSRINSVISFFRHTREVDLKIVLTTRDYGLQQIQLALMDLPVAQLNISKFTDDEIIEIIKSEPYGITASAYHEKIQTIANGNARLAIMMADLVVYKKKSINDLNNVAELIDLYFSSFIRDEKQLANKTLLRTLGIISFFYTFPYTNTEVVEEAAYIFNLSRAELIDSINTLDELELVDINFDHVKIADQTLATYYFYKIFVKDKLCSLHQLLKHYFPNNASRFNDSFYPVVNSFGFTEVKELTYDDLKKYYDELRQTNTVQAFNFLTTFYFYLHVEALAFVIDVTQTVRENQDPFDLNYDDRSSHTKLSDPYIDLLANFFETDVYLREGLEASFEYCRKEPGSLKVLLKDIVQELKFDQDDYEHGFNRQKILFNLFQEKCSQRDSIYVMSFLAIAHEFLEFGFRHSKGVRGNKISLYTIRFVLTSESKKVRMIIWENLAVLFPYHPELVLRVLEKHARRKPDVEKKVLEFDLEFLIPFIQENLSPLNFSHNLYIHELLHWVKRQGIEVKDRNSLAVKFQNREYHWYKKLNWERFRGKEDFEFENWDEFQQLKEKDIREFTFFSDREEFIKFIEFFKELKGKLIQESYNLNNSIDIILEEQVRKDPQTGAVYFTLALQYLPTNDPRFLRTISLIGRSPDLQALFWDLYKNGKVTDDQALTFIAALPVSDVSPDWLDKFYQILTQSRENQYIYPFNYKNLFEADPDFLKKVGEISVSKNQLNSGKIQLDHFFFEMPQTKNLPIALLEKIYLQQDRLLNHFDYSGDALFGILEDHPEFILTYLEHISGTDDSRHADKKSLGKVWNLPNAIDIMDNVFEHAANHDHTFRVHEHFVNSFFKSAPTDKRSIVEDYIIYFIKRFNRNPKKMELMFDVIYHSHKWVFNKAFDAYIRSNPSKDDFAAINWTERQLVYSGDVIIGDLKAAQWRSILTWVEDANLGLNGISIVKYIKDQIAAEKRHGDWERERKFLSRNV